MPKEFFVYIMASGRNGTLYIGVTSDLCKRVREHKEGLFGGFTAEYGVNNPYWRDLHDEITA